MQSKTEILKEKLLKDSPKTTDTTSHIISFLPEAIEGSELQKALSSFVFNKSCYYANQPQRIEDAFVRYVYKDNQNTINEMLNKYPELKIHQLLGYIASGNQDEAEKMLKEHPELLLQSGSVIDPSARLFKNIKPFELVIWTMDVRYMANMVLKCIPKDERGEKIRSELLKQYQKVIEDFDAEKKTGGVQYTLNSEKHHEKYFDFQPLIKALDTRVKNYDSWTDDQCLKHWITVIGAEQSTLPMHVRHHYCDLDERFFPTPTFDKKELKRSLEFFSAKKKGLVLWGEIDGLGVDFAIFRGAGASWGGEGGGDGSLDLAAIRKLCEARTLDLGLLKVWLLQSIQKSEEFQESFRMIF